MPQSIRAESLRPSLLHNELHRWSRKRNDAGKTVNSVFSTTSKEGAKITSRITAVLLSKRLNLNGGQGQDRTADAGPFSATQQRN